MSAYSILKFLTFVICLGHVTSSATDPTGDERTSLVRIFIEGIYNCGGVLVDRRWIVTAAICVEKPFRDGLRIRAYLGGWTEKGERAEQAVKIDFVLVNPNYDGVKDDIAMIHLSEPANVCRNIIGTYTEFSNAKLDDIAIDDNTDCVTLGWSKIESVNKLSSRDQAAYIMGKVFQSLFDITSRTSRSYGELRVPKIDIVRNKQCQDEIAGFNFKEVCYNIISRGLHPDDVGSPIMCDIRNKWRLVGLHSGRLIQQIEDKCYTKSALRLSHYKDWITETLVLSLPGEACRKAVDCLGDDVVCVDDICSQQVGYNGTCYNSRQCNADGLKCETDNVCRCRNGYILIEDECFQKKDEGESCVDTLQCIGDKQACRQGVCKCLNAYIIVDDTCLKRRDFGEPCTDSRQCVGNNQTCTAGQCQCSPGYLEVSSTCYPERDLGGECTFTDQCIGANQNCSSNTCQCLDNHVIFDGDTCLPESLYGEACTESEQCIDGNNTCNNNTCTCEDDFVYISPTSTCMPSKDYGESCTYDPQCSANQECSNNTCQCLATYTPVTVAGNIQCLSEAAFGDACSYDDQCIDGDYTACNNGSCGCDELLAVPLSATCYPYADFGEQCVVSEQCAVNGTACITNNTCLCEPWYNWGYLNRTCILNCVTINKMTLFQYDDVSINGCVGSVFTSFNLNQCEQVCLPLGNCVALEYNSATSICTTKTCKPDLGGTNLQAAVNTTLFIPGCNDTV